MAALTTQITDIASKSPGGGGGDGYRGKKEKEFFDPTKVQVTALSDQAVHIGTDSAAFLTRFRMLIMGAIQPYEETMGTHQGCRLVAIPFQDHRR